MRIISILFVFLLTGVVSAQTETPTPTFTIPLSQHVFATVTSGQMTRFDYIATAGSIHIANLLTLIFASLWGMFLFIVFVLVKRGRK